MKKLIALAVVVVIALPLIGTATASSGPTLAQFKRLKQRVVRVENRFAVIETEQACLGQTFSITNHRGHSYAEYDSSTNTYSGSEVFDYFDTNPAPRTDGFVIDQETRTFAVVTKTC